ncbi:MAG: MnmC family methyltransferase, partial [Bacteroidia bacterium]
GLNAFLTLEESQKNSLIKFFYHSIEACPIQVEIAEKFNYRAENADLLKLHNGLWNSEQTISENFIFCKHKVKLLEFDIDKKFDIIYYDAFGPRAQAEMWTEESLLHACSFLKTDGLLVTYCAKGDVKRIFRKFGFVVQTLKGPPGKREMIRVVNKRC